MSETDVGLSALPDGWVWTTLEKISYTHSAPLEHRDWTYYASIDILLRWSEK